MHVRDIISGQTSLDSKELIKSSLVRARNEARAMQETNIIRQKRGKRIRTHYDGTKLLTKDNKIIPGTKIGG